MKQIPLEIIQAAKNNNIEAAEQIKRHYEGYIAKLCLQTMEGNDGNPKQFVDEDFRYLAEIALYAAIFKFQFRDPPEDFQP